MNGVELQDGEFERVNGEFLNRIFKLLLQDAVIKGTDIHSKLEEFEQPEKLFTQLDFELRDKGEDDDILIELCRNTIKYCVKTGHPHFFNQLYSGYDPYGLAGAWLTDALNTSQYTFEVAPVFTLMEATVFKRMREAIGYENGEGDGIFCPGGSVSNMYGISLARFQRFPNVKEEGMHGLPKLCIFTSQQSHYSLLKGVSFMGIGTKYLIKVACDARGKMDPVALEKAIIAAKDQGLYPLMVNATAATTVVGAYDPFNAIADICEKYSLWMHVDAAWGGGVLMSRKHRSLMAGVERCDSMAWNPHKMMGTPLQCAVFLTKHKNLLNACHSASARYLFQQDKNYDVSYDTGDKSVQCGRKVDVFKLWLMWKAKGNIGFEKEINNAFEKSSYLANKLRETPGFRLVYDQPECTNVCFWYIPPRLRGQEETPEWWADLGKVAPVIKQRMMEKGSLLIGYQPLEEKPNFFRMVISNLKTTQESMDFVVSEIELLGKDL
ncbi:unnamed protein product [Owenia fusiformis]|uniref:Cysteine sulfinic acid decarboxylase n=1 Tax=Owenia fusiformis TaxID=6347 RepID=A0A8S4N1X7_OWEFU|nr:unnamed protein product [Owenia fusiformis]